EAWRQNSRAIRRCGHGVFPVRSPRTVFGVRGPLIIGVDEVVFGAQGNQQLNSERGTFLDHWAPVGFTFVGKEMIFVHRPANAVAAKAIDDKKVNIPLFLSRRGGNLDGMRDISQTVSRLHGLNALVKDPRGGIVKLLCVFCELPNAEGPSGVPYPTV